MAICGPFGTSPVAQWCFDQHLTPHPRKPDQSLRPAGSTFERCPSNPAPTSLPVPSMPTRGLSRLQIQPLLPSWDSATLPSFLNFPYHPSAHSPPRAAATSPQEKSKEGPSSRLQFQLPSSISPKNPRVSSNIGLIRTVAGPSLANQIPPQPLINLPNPNATLFNSSHNPALQANLNPILLITILLIVISH